jgi:hypothetical protein
MKKLWLGVGVALALAAAGCGQSTARGPTLAGVPLPPGTKVVEHVRRCDRGANPYCAIQLVVVGRRYKSSLALLDSERRHLRAIGWSSSSADIGTERAADSPGHKLRLVYATAALDLQAVDLGWVRRSPEISTALSRTMFARQSAMSLMLETGSS